MPTNTAAVGDVGLGVMGRRHVRAVAEHRQLSLAGVVDIDERRAATVGDEFGVDHWTDYEALYEQGLDGVVVATPESAHLDPTHDALERGYDLLLEKPLSSEADRSRAIAEAVRRANASTLVGFTLRFDARYANLAEQAIDGEFGRLLSLRAGRSVVTEEARRMRRTHPLLYQTIHDIDALRWIVDEPVKRVYSQSTTDRLADVGRTDVILTTLTFADGTVACIETGSVLPKGSPAGNLAYLDVTGTDGGARIETPGQSFTATTDRVQYHDTGLFPTVRGKVGGALAREIDHFASVLIDGTEPVVTVEDARRAEAIARTAIAANDAAEALPVPEDTNEPREYND
jgi:myo-inositol 2-dehydrogenase/D-chiro-inositol 1-dehydrogenase